MDCLAPRPTSYSGHQVVPSLDLASVERLVPQHLQGATLLLALSLVACSPKLPSDFVAADPTKRSDTWAVERADIDCKAEARSRSWAYRLRLNKRAAPAYVACMEQRGFIKNQVAQ